MATTPKAARTISRIVAPVSEPVAAIRITQHSTAPPTIIHRFRFRGDSEARAGLRVTSPCSLIQHPFPGSVQKPGCPAPRLTGSSLEDAVPTRARQRNAGSFQISGI